MDVKPLAKIPNDIWEFLFGKSVTESKSQLQPQRVYFKVLSVNKGVADAIVNNVFEGISREISGEGANLHQAGGDIGVEVAGRGDVVWVADCVQGF